MKKQQIRISNQEEFNKHLQHTNPVTWVVLCLVIALLVSFFAWSFLYKLTIKIMGKADVENGAVTLHMSESDISKLRAGQKVYINDEEGEILYDKKIDVTNFTTLSDGEYTYKIIIGEMRPVDFLIGK